MLLERERNRYECIRPSRLLRLAVCIRTNNIRACLVIGFKHSFLCSNPKNGGPGSILVCLALVLSFWIKKFSQFI
jgi:hypothetical protein